MITRKLQRYNLQLRARTVLMEKGISLTQSTNMIEFQYAMYVDPDTVRT